MSGRRRTLKNLESAILLDGPPPFMADMLSAEKHNKGSANWAGIKYERQFADYMIARYGDDAMYGKWIEYTDERGKGWCQPDLILKHPDGIIICECKLSYRPFAAQAKLSTMYAPCLKLIFTNGSVHTVQVCRNLKPAAKRTTLIANVKEILQCPTNSVLTWNWRPR